MDLSLGRSNCRLACSLLPFSVTEQDDSYFPPSENQPSLIESKCGRSIIHSNYSNT